MADPISLPGDLGVLELQEAEDGLISAIARRRFAADIWRAEPPDGPHDAWVAVEVDDGAVIANSWSGWCVRYDLATGSEMERAFTK